MWHEAALEGDTAGLELVGAAGIFAVDEAHELGGGVAVVVGGTVLDGMLVIAVGGKGRRVIYSVARYVPSRAEDEEVCERS